MTRLTRTVVRDAVTTAKSFTTGELANMLGCSKQTATRWLSVMQEDGHVKKGRRVFGEPTWEYVKPSDAGEAFVNQRRHLASVPPPEVAAVTQAASRNEDIKVRKLHDQIKSKEVREAVMEAEADGWELSRTGTDHFALRKDGMKLNLSNSPRSASTMAKYIRQNRRNAEAGRGRHAS